MRAVPGEGASWHDMGKQEASGTDGEREPQKGAAGVWGRGAGRKGSQNGPAHENKMSWSRSHGRVVICPLVLLGTIQKILPAPSFLPCLLDMVPTGPIRDDPFQISSALSPQAF